MRDLYAALIMLGGLLFLATPVFLLAYKTYKGACEEVKLWDQSRTVIYLEEDELGGDYG